MNYLTILIIILVVYIAYFAAQHESFVDIGLNTVNYKNSEFPLKLFCAAKYDKPTFELTPGGEFKYI